MTAVTAAPMPVGNHTSEKDTAYETSPPGFTAVNGQDSGPNGASSANDSPRTTDSTIKVGGDFREARDSTHPSSRPPTPPAQPEDNNQEMKNGDHNEHHQARSHDSSPAAHKRKRSQSDDGDISSSSNSRYNHSPSQAGDRPPQSDGRFYGSAPPDSASRHSSHDVAVGHESRHSQSHNGSNGHMHSHTNSWNDRGQAAPPNHHPHGRHLEQSEAILREALQRDSQLHDTPHRSWGVPTRSEGDSGDGEQYSHYSQDGTPTGSGQGNPKRKRVFSNRTKTGCLTCRRRKKKCDEGQPQCNNCLRGGFQCEGYSTRSTWSKPLNTKAPVPLQSKDGFPDVSDHGYKIDDNSPRQGRSSLNGREGIQARPIVVDDVDHQLHTQLTASPTSAGPRSRGSYPGQPWPNPTNPSYLSDRGQAKQDYLPSFSEIARDSNKPEYRPMAPMRDMSHPGHNTSQPPPGPPPPAQSAVPQWSSYPPAGQPDYRQAYHHPHHQAPAPPHAQHADVSNFQNTARMALNVEQQQSATRSSTNDDSEKTKMIRGQAFKRSDPTLAADRLRCKAALQRFNSAGMVDQTADTTSWNLLKQVITPTPTAGMVPKDKTVGSLGPGTVVETPFDCEYGYNIKIGEDVDIGRNCLIVDVCPVVIGQKTTIGRNVSIVSGGPGTDNVDRKGVNSTWQGRAITIENDVIIGDGSYIYQGVRLGARCTIEPGSVVKHDVGPDQRFGPPASGPIQLNEIGPRQSR